MSDQPGDVLDRARRHAGLSPVELWLRYFELGGMDSPLEVEAYGMLQHVSDNLGVVEAIVAARLLRRGISRRVSSASGAETIAFVARGTMLCDRFPAPGPLPGWLTEDDLGFYAGEFERTGFRGALVDWLKSL